MAVARSVSPAILRNHVSTEEGKQIAYAAKDFKSKSYRQQSSYNHNCNSHSFSLPFAAVHSLLQNFRLLLQTSFQCLTRPLLFSPHQPAYDPNDIIAQDRTFGNQTTPSKKATWCQKEDVTPCKQY